VRWVAACSGPLINPFTVSDTPRQPRQDSRQSPLAHLAGVPEDVIASPYGVPRGSTEAIAHDASSYDTLSNLEAICKLRATAAPKRSLVLISDPLHMARIWPQRWRIDCVDDSLLGYDTVAVAGGPVWKWYLASRDCLADAARLLLGEGFYRSAIQQWRWLQDS
jgi:hypothetical protein